MSYIKLELSSMSELLVGDVFRTVEKIGNLSQTSEYEVVGKVVIESVPHPSFPELILHTAIFKAKNRRNGKGRTCKYKDCAFQVWRKV